MTYLNDASFTLPANIRTQLFSLYGISCSHGDYDASVAHVFLDPLAFKAYSSIDILSGAGIPEGYAPLSRSISIRIPTEGFEIYDEPVKLQFEIPVKVGLFLHYLNNKMSDPTTTMQFRDEVLTYEFTMSGVLR